MRQSLEQIHCGAIGFRFIPPPERQRARTLDLVFDIMSECS